MNLNDTSLEDKWKKLLGSEIDSDLFEYNLSLEKNKNLFKQFVKIVNIETFSYCNRHCSYCPVSLLETKKNSYLKDSYLNQIINNLKEINYSNKISLNLYNEPLSDKSIFDTIYKLRQSLPDATIFFNSNGDYLTKEILEKLSNLGLNSIHITLHTLPKEEYSDEKSLIKIKKFYDKLGFDYTIDTQKKDQYIRTSFHFNELFVSIETTNYAEYGESRAGSLDNLVETKKRDWPCARPYREFTLFSNGHAYPCCQIYAPLDNDKNSVGSLENYNSIFELYCSKGLASLRKHLHGYGTKKSPCDVCTEPFLHADRTKLV
jgi:hypothetical protein